MANAHANSETGEEDSVMTVSTAQKDNISALPDDILYSIISFLGMNETVCASILSVKWRNLCASRSSLRFYWRDVFNTSATFESWQGLKDEYVRRVDQFLKFHTGSKIVQFIIGFGLGREYTPYLDRWISFSVSKGVEELCINLLRCDIQVSNTIENRHELYVFPCQLLSQGGTSRLESLFLRSCILGIDLSTRLSSLKNLMLQFVPLESRDWHNIFSSCLNLVTLRVEFCSLPNNLLVCGSLPHFECLMVLYCSGVKEIELLAHNLIVFEYAWDLVKLRFTEVPKLEKVYLRVYGGFLNSFLNTLARDLPQLKNLSVHPSSYSVQWLPTRLTTFSNVKQLELYFSGGMEMNITRLAAVLSACPILKIFHLMVNSSSNEQRQPHEAGFEEYGHNQLKEVEIGGFTCPQNMTSYATYLLKHAVALELMILKRQVKLYQGGNIWICGDRTSWDIGERELMREQLQEYVSNNMVLIIR